MKDVSPKILIHLLEPERARERGTHSSSERLERIHALLVLAVVLAELLVAAHDVAEAGLRPCRHRAGIVAVRLEVAHLLVQLEVVGLERLDLGAQLRDRVELAAQLLRTRKREGGVERRRSQPEQGGKREESGRAHLLELAVALPEAVALRRDDGQDGRLGRALERCSLYGPALGRLRARTKASALDEVGRGERGLERTFLPSCSPASGSSLAALPPCPAPCPEPPATPPPPPTPVPAPPPPPLTRTRSFSSRSLSFFCSSSRAWSASHSPAACSCAWASSSCATRSAVTSSCSLRFLAMRRFSSGAGREAALALDAFGSGRRGRMRSETDEAESGARSSRSMPANSTYCEREEQGKGVRQRARSQGCKRSRDAPS